MVISQLVPFARDAGHSAAVAAFALTVGAIGSASGRVLSGWISDHAGRLNTLRVMLLVSASAMPMLFLFRDNVVLFTACSRSSTTATERSSRCTRPRAPTSTARRTSASTTDCCSSRGSGRHPRPISRWPVYVATHEYRWAFFVAAAFSLVALGVLLLAKNPHAAPARAAQV